MSKATFSQLQQGAAIFAGEDTPDSRAIIGDLLNDAQWEFQVRHNWRFFKVAEDEVTISSGVSIYSVPSTLRWVTYIFYKDTDGKAIPLDPSSGSDFMREINMGDPDVPYLWRPFGQDDVDPENPGAERLKQFQVGPPPSAGFISNYGDKLYLENHRKATRLSEPGQYHDWPAEFELPLKIRSAELYTLTQPDLSLKAALKEEYKIIMSGLMADDRFQGDIPEIRAKPRARYGRYGLRRRRRW